MTSAVVTAPSAQRDFVARNLPGVVDVIAGFERIYVLCRVSSGGADLEFSDPVDGVLLVECRFFTDEPSARSWVAADIARRAAEAIH